MSGMKYLASLRLLGLSSMNRTVGRIMPGAAAKGPRLAKLIEDIQLRPRRGQVVVRFGPFAASVATRALKQMRPGPGGSLAARVPGLGTGRGGDVTGSAIVLGVSSSIPALARRDGDRTARLAQR